jgi:hypothetical protein
MTLDTEQSAPMGWKLFLVDRVLSNDEIASTFAEIFDLESDDVMVIEAEEETDDELPENILILCERSPVKGDFQICLSIYPQDDELEKIVNKNNDDIEVIKRFADILECNCLIVDPHQEDLNDEDACLFIQGLEGYIEEVDLDPEYLDKDEYIILKSDDSEDEQFLSIAQDDNLNIGKVDTPQIENCDPTAFHLIDMDRYYFLYQYQDKIIHLPKDVAIGKNDSILTVLIISQATYRDTSQPLSASDSEALEHFLIEETQKEGIDIIIE